VPNVWAADFVNGLLTDESTASLPFGLDVWTVTRVLSVAWNRTELVVVTFRHGPWERWALALG
jgi:hypothetical protein